MTPNAANGPVCGPTNPILIGAPSASGWVASAGQLSVGTLNVSAAASVDAVEDSVASVEAVLSSVDAAVLVSGAAAVVVGPAAVVAVDPLLSSLPQAAAISDRHTAAATPYRACRERCLIGSSPLLLVEHWQLGWRRAPPVQHRGLSLPARSVGMRRAVQGLAASGRRRRTSSAAVGGHRRSRPA